MSYLDLLASLPDDFTWGSDVDIDSKQLEQAKHGDSSKKSIKPFIDVCDLNRADEDKVNEVKPKPAVVIGLKGDF